MGRARGNLHRLAAERRRTTRKQTRSAPSRWTHDSDLRKELRKFTSGMSHWPTRREFEAAHRGDLRCAVDAYGGPPFWAKELGLTLSARQLRAVPYTDADAVRDARSVVAALGYLPGVRRLRAEGFARLATRVQSGGGSQRFAVLHGLNLRDGETAES